MRLSQSTFTHKSPHSAQEYTLVCFSDIHINRHLNPKVLSALTTRARQISPDYIIITGDFIDCASELKFRGIETLALSWLDSLTAIAPVIFIYGNHDIKAHKKDHTFHIPHAFRDKLSRIPNLHILDNSTYADDNFFFAGFTPSFKYYRTQQDFVSPGDPKIFQKELTDFCNSLPPLPDKPRLFLTHVPIHGKILTSTLTDFDLILTGHMHNGCVPAPFSRLPGTYGFLGPSWKTFPKFARGKIRNLIILPPVLTFASKFRFLQCFYHNFYTVIKIK